MIVTERQARRQCAKPQAHLRAQVLSLNHETRLLLFMSVDCIFAATTFAFLFLGERYGDQRNARYPRYPGAPLAAACRARVPWSRRVQRADSALCWQGRGWSCPGTGGCRSTSTCTSRRARTQQPPSLLWQCPYAHWLSRACLAQLLPALTGLLLPVLALPAAAYNEHGWLGATVLVPYLFTLGVQIWSETRYNKRGAALPAVPSHGLAGLSTLQHGVLTSACLAEVGLGHGGLRREATFGSVNADDALFAARQGCALRVCVRVRLLSQRSRSRARRQGRRCGR